MVGPSGCGCRGNFEVDDMVGVQPDEIPGWSATAGFEWYEQAHRV